MILDLNMPNLDGFGVLADINRRPLDRQPPVLVLTARNASADVQRRLSLGASDCLAKPFKDAVLLARLARLVRSKTRRSLTAANSATEPKFSPYRQQNDRGGQSTIARFRYRLTSDWRRSSFYPLRRSIGKPVI